MSKRYKQSKKSAKLGKEVRNIKFNLEFRKGILFVRVENKINKKDFEMNKDNLNNIIKKIGIKYIVLNFNEIKQNDYFNIKFIINNYNLIKKNHGKLFLCGAIDNNLSNMFLKMKIDKLSNEIEVFKKLKEETWLIH